MSDVVLWHIPISHYSEKARWALAYKGVEHERRAPQPPLHIPVALALTRGQHKTFPVLELDGQRVGDSTAVIAALEERYPQPPLYPADPAQRERALALEDYFDDVGHHVRLVGWHELTRDDEALEAFAAQDARGPEALRRLAPKGVRGFVNLRYRVADPTAAETSRRRVLEGLDRLEAELDQGGGDYLVGDSFSVADLTAAALFYPLVLPPEAPTPFPRLPEAFERFRQPLLERRGFEWVREMFRRHRRAAPAPTSRT